MPNSIGRKSPSKAKPTFAYAILSVTLVLLIVAALSGTFFAVNKTLVELKESIEIEVELTTQVTEDQIKVIKTKLDTAQYINTVVFEGKEEAIKKFEKELNQDIVGIAGFNPLYDAFVITLKNAYSSPQELEKIKENLLATEGVRSINYSSAVLELVNANVQKVLTVGIIGVVLLLLIAFSLIDNTIRLMMFSQRFIIRSMQLIGATEGFIIKPFIIRGLIAGVVSGTLAILIIGGGMYFINQQYAWFELGQEDYVILGTMAGGLIISGIFICVLSTFLSVNKYLGMKLDELY